MKTVQLLKDVVIAGVPHGPDSDPLMLDNDAADALIRDKLAEESDDLDTLKLDELKDLAASEGVIAADAVLKADFKRAIRDHRLAAAA